MRQLLVSDDTKRAAAATATTAARPSRRQSLFRSVLLAVGAVALGVWSTRRAASPAEPLAPLTVTVQQLTLSGDVDAGALSADGKFVPHCVHRNRESSLSNPSARGRE